MRLTARQCWDKTCSYASSSDNMPYTLFEGKRNLHRSALIFPTVKRLGCWYIMQQATNGIRIQTGQGTSPPPALGQSSAQNCLKKLCKSLLARTVGDGRGHGWVRWLWEDSQLGREHDNRRRNSVEYDPVDRWTRILTTIDGSRQVHVVGDSILRRAIVTEG